MVRREVARQGGTQMKTIFILIGLIIFTQFVQYREDLGTQPGNGSPVIWWAADLHPQRSAQIYDSKTFLTYFSGVIF